MNGLQSLLKTPMYLSQCEPAPPSSKSLNYLSSSYIGLNQGEKNFRYERVGNMFKLVEAKSVAQQNNETAAPANNDRVAKLERTVSELMQRVTKIETSVPNIGQKCDDLLTDIDSLNYQAEFTQAKLDKALLEVSEVRERLQEIEEQEFVYEQGIREITANVKLFNQQLEKSISHQQEEFMAQLHKLQERFSQELSTAINKGTQNSLNTTMDTLSPKKELGKADRCHLLRYTQTYESEGAVYKVDQSSYRVDVEGRLLDEEGYRVLDEHNQEIRLDAGHLKKLREFGLLKN